MKVGDAVELIKPCMYDFRQTGLRAGSTGVILKIILNTRTHEPYAAAIRFDQYITNALQDINKTVGFIYALDRLKEIEDEPE